MANQIIIDIGAVANDGTGDPLRTAFGYVNNNFSNIWASGVANSNIAFDGNRILTTNTNGNLVLAPNGIGKVQSNVDIIPNANNTLSLGSLTRQWNTVYAQNLAVDGNVSIGDLTVDGNLTVNGTTTTINTANVDIEDKMITLAFGSGTANLANGAGINVAGANANITYLSTGDKWSLNKNTDIVGNLAVSGGSLTITGPLGNVWRLNGDKIISPAGGSWESIANTEYFSSGIDGYVHINSFDVTGNIASAIKAEHSFIQFNIYNGIDAQWRMNTNGTTSFPNYTFPYADGNVGETLVSDGNGTLTWAPPADTYGNANVAEYLPTYNGNISVAYINVANVVNVQNDVLAKRGTFTGDPVTGDASLYIGSPSFTPLGTDVMAQFTGNVPNYAQLNLQNYGNSNTASGDYIITADNGSDSTHFLNLGLTGSNWDGSQPNSLGNRLGPNDGYLYVQDGDMVIGTSNGTIETWKFGQDGTLTVPGDIVPAVSNTQSLGSATNQWSDLWVSNSTIYMNSVPITLGAGNVLTVNGEALLSNDSNTSISTTGNITADFFIGDGSQLTNLPFDASQIENGTSNVAIATANGNVTVTANSTQTWTFGADGNLTTPSNLVISPSGIGTGTAIAQTDAPLQIASTDANGSASIGWYGNPTGPGNVVQVALNQTGGSMTVVTGDYSDTTYVWDFDAVGNLTLPTGGNIYYGNGTIYGGGAGSYGNADVATFLGAYGSNTVVTTGNITGGNVIATANILGNGYGSFRGTFDESQASTAGIYLGYAGGTPRIMFGTGNTSQTFEIDNDGGNLRFYQPGSTKATLTSTGDLSTLGNITATGKIGYASGGTVTQSSSGSGVTLNQLTGAITLAKSSWVANDLEAFVVQCNKVSADDYILAQISGTYSTYFMVSAYYFTGTSFFINVRALDTISSAPVVKFFIMKAPIA